MPRSFATNSDALRQNPGGNREQYATYLRSPEWDAKRRGRMALAQYRCEVCNSGEHLQVHHRTYARRGRELLEDLIVLCEPCHELFTRYGRLENAA